MMKRAVWLALLGIVLLAPALWVRGVRAGSKPAFRKRSLMAAASGSPQTIPKYENFVERALMIRDPAIVDDADFQPEGSWSFASVVRRALTQVTPASQAAPPSEQAQVIWDQWRKRMEADDRVAMGIFEAPWKASGYSLERTPVHLLAIVNRADLARIDHAACQNSRQPGSIGGAEVRFVFSGLPVGTDFSYLDFIVEFVLPCMSKQDFRELASDWSKLADGSFDKTALEHVLDRWTRRSVSVRLRTNATTGSNTWDVREFVFTQAELQPHLLEDQFGRSVQLFQCQTASMPMGQFAQANLDQILKSNYDLKNLATDSATVNAAGIPIVLTLDSKLIAGPRLDDARFSLSINSCNGCHGFETGTSFHHVGQRRAGEKSPLSAFLTGSKDGSLSQASYQSVQPPAADGCHVTANRRQFNDLLRRYHFLTTVGGLKASAGDKEWERAFDAFGASETH